MRRRNFVNALLCVIAGGPEAVAGVMTSDLSINTRDGFIDWMSRNRNEETKFLIERWERYRLMVRSEDVWGERNIRAFLATPRQEFVTPGNIDRAYVWHHLDIGFGVTITGPNTVAKMTSTLNVRDDDKVLEIGTGSGYQSAYLSNLTRNVWTIEIITALAARTQAVYQRLIDKGFNEYSAIKTRVADGYDGWEEAAPFDKIIVTCGIDHVPPPLLRQLKLGGIMVIPVGPPGAQHVLKITTKRDSHGTVVVARADIYGGVPIPFVPFRAISDGRVAGVHSLDKN